MAAGLPVTSLVSVVAAGIARQHRRSVVAVLGTEGEGSEHACEYDDEATGLQER